MSLCACTGQPIKSLSSCECLLHFTLSFLLRPPFLPPGTVLLSALRMCIPLMSQTGAFFMDVQVCVRSAYRYDVVNCPSCVCVCVCMRACVCCVHSVLHGCLLSHTEMWQLVLCHLQWMHQPSVCGRQGSSGAKGATECPLLCDTATVFLLSDTTVDHTAVVQLVS